MKLRDPACAGCGLHTGVQTVCLLDEERLGPHLIMVVGEAPGATEDREGTPFVGDAGRKLRDLLGRAGLSPQGCYITNAVKCRPPKNRAPRLGEIRACSSFLRAEMEEVRPEYVVLLGNTALQAVLGRKGISKERGHVVEWEGKKVLPTFHPAALLRQPARLQVFLDDLKIISDAIYGSARQALLE